MVTVREPTLVHARRGDIGDPPKGARRGAFGDNPSYVIRGGEAAMSGVVGDAASQRVFRDGAVSRTKALIAAIVVGFAAAVATYKLLRSAP